MPAAQTFTHEPRRPARINGHPDGLSNFANVVQRVRVVRHGDAPTAEVQMRLYTGDAHAALFDELDADACEALARSLLDAAHDLRANPCPRAAQRATDPGVPA